LHDVVILGKPPHVALLYLDANVARRATPSKQCIINNRNYLRVVEMSVNSLWQLAQFKLYTECMRADHKLLLVVGHANLLHSLSNLEEEQAQRFERELAASNAKVEKAKGAHAEQLYTMSEKLRSSGAWPFAVLVLT
jgi:hypothetical protein